MPLGPMPSKLQASLLPDSSGSVVRLKRAVRNASLVSRPESCRRSPIRTRRVIKRSQTPLTTILETTAPNRRGQESPLAASRLLNAVVSSPEVFSIHGTPCNTSNEIFVTRHRFRESAKSQLSRESSRLCGLFSSAVDLCDDSFEDSLTVVNLLQHNQPIEVEPKSSPMASEIPLGIEIMHLGLLYWVFKQALRNIGYPTTALRFTVVAVVQTATRLTRVIFRVIFFYPLMFMGIVTKSLQIRLGEGKSLVEKLQTRALPPPGMDNQTRSLDFLRWLVAALQP
ncbi:hypothetical protein METBISCDRAFT_28448 [Metschnikowia bicuspidata]|uniref:Uncharacterized protein n=1 Tax=Metschnikowia bicuspidata TaxID=27322 RepID=A0A4P9ZBI1_9ASCO|nr:hypothetical protein METBISCDRAFT_28448 [Metschnikowia bicuspidata]